MRPTPRPARLAVAAVFFINGAGLANWFVRIPDVKDKLGLSEGALGIALLGAAVGALLVMPLTGALVARMGSRPVVRITALFYCLTLALPPLAPSLPSLMLALVALGAGNGALDVAMNAQAVAVERDYRRPIMSSFHALWSIGGLVGASVGGALASRSIGTDVHLIWVAAVLGVSAVVASGRLLPAGADSGSRGPAFARPTRALAGLGVISFCVLLGEGAMHDWSAVYLRGTLETGPGLAAAGYAAFSLAMAAGRLAGDRLEQALGPVFLVRLGGAVAAGGLGAALAIGHPAAAIVGLACAGAGFSIVFPMALSAAGSTPGMAPGAALAALTTVGYSGFLVGPPMIGFLAEAVGLGGALYVVVGLSATIAVLAGAVAKGEAQKE